MRAPKRAPRLKHAQVAAADYLDRAALLEALDGIERVFFVSAFEAADRLGQHKAAIDAFVEAGVRQVVYTSFVNCAADSVFTFARDHYHTERHMQARGLPFAALRNNLYAEMVPRLVTDGAIRGPAGEGRFAPVARADVADLAVVMLTDPAVPTGRFDVTGPELVSMRQAAALLTEVTGREVVYVDETLEEARASRRGLEASPYEIEGWISSYRAIAAGEMEVLSDAVERYTGHRPMTLREALGQGG